jgi:hypothetical protein
MESVQTGVTINIVRMLKKPVSHPAQPRRAKTRRSAGKAAASEEVRLTRRYVEPVSEARTKPAAFFSILSEENDPWI